MEKFWIRPGLGEARQRIEFCGDHRNPDFPDLARLLAGALGATRLEAPVSAAETMIATDRYVSCWSYAEGTYEIDDDSWACFVTVPDGSARVLADIEQALTASGRFARSFT